jgi:type I restriction enzyme S subunit
VNWRSVSLGQAGTIVGGGTPSTANSKHFGDGYPWITPKDLSRQRSRFVRTGERSITDSGLRASSAKLLPTGTVILSSRAPIGLTAIAAVPLTTNQGCRSFVPGAEVDTLFMYYLLTSMKDEFERRANGSTFKEISGSTLSAIEVLLPPLEEQRGIAATLGALDDKIESNRRAIALMEDLTRTHFDRLFDIRFDDEGVALSTLIAVNPRRKLSDGESSTYVGMSSLPEFSAEIYEWETKPAGSGARFTNGDVLMARITPCLENGKTAVVDMLEHDEVAWGSTEYIVLAPQGDIKTSWIYCLARNDEVRSFAIRSMTGSSGRQRFKADRFDQYKITPPAPAALEEFNAIAEPVFRRMKQLRDENLCALALRDALLPELLSGRIRVPEAREAVEEVVA